MIKHLIIGSLFVFSHLVFAEDRADVKTTSSGHNFTPVKAEELVKNYKMTEEQAKKFVGDGAFKDENGTIWGDVAKREDGETNIMNHKDAEDYCKELGAELPSGYPESQNNKNGDKDSDFIRLSKYMGAGIRSDKYLIAGSSKPPYPIFKVFQAQVLPNMSKRFGRFFWSSSVLPDDDDNAYQFDGHSGQVDSSSRSNDFFATARCIVRATILER